MKTPHYSYGGMGTVGTLSTRRLVFLGNSLDPHPLVLQGDIAFPPSSTTVSAGDVLVPAHDQYSQLYGSSNVLGSSWHLQFTNVFDATCRVAVVVCPYEATQVGSAGLLGRVAALDSMSFDNLSVQPYAKVYNLNQPDSGHETKTFRIYRRSKAMLGVTNMKDRKTVASETLPLANGNNLPGEGWFLYCRPDVAGTGSTTYVEFSARAVIYTQLTSREPIEMPVVGA